MPLSRLLVAPLRPAALAALCSVALYLSSLACGDAAADISPGDSEAETAVPVETLRLVPRPFDERYAAPGVVEADERATVAAEIAGRVLRVHLEIGEPVSRGTVLVELDARAQQAQVQRLEADVARARTELAWAQRDLERQLRLFEDQVTAEQARDAAQRAFDVASDELAAREADLAVARVDLERTTIRSPLDARVARRHVSPGEYVAPGTPLYDLVATDPVKFVFSVSERDVVSLNGGEEIEVEIDARPERAYRGTVVGIAPAGAEGTRTFRVELRMENPVDAPLLPGMAGRADVVRRRHDSAYLVPESALLREGDRSYLFLVRDGRAVRAETRIVSQTADLAVLSTDLVLTSESAPARDGAAAGADLGSAAEPAELQVVILGQAAIAEGDALRVRRVHDQPPSSVFD